MRIELSLFLGLFFFLSPFFNSELFANRENEISIQRMRKARELQNSGKAEQSRQVLAIVNSQRPKNRTLKLQARVFEHKISKPHKPGEAAQVTSKAFIECNFEGLYAGIKDCICGSKEHIALKRKLLDHAIKTGNTEAVRALANFLQAYDKTDSKVPYWKLILAIILFLIGIWQIFEVLKAR